MTEELQFDFVAGAYEPHPDELAEQLAVEPERKETTPKSVLEGPVRWPRQYAVQIMQAPRDERKALFDNVPARLQALVRLHCQCTQDRNRMRRR